ncbi:N-6 DNA methylase [Candidatus Phytoplasma fraxini]|uniref:DNA methylase adenine-specific domain-containing protein n=1 Tax=Ash yellows phytoplasma TaxID=35780 RepID=A0ABZ2UBV9_ASHYP
MPQCDTIVFFDYKQSYIEIIQTIGRALRKDLENAEKRVTIILPFDIEHSLNTGISLDNKDFFKLFATILSIDQRNNSYKRQTIIDQTTKDLPKINSSKTNNNKPSIDPCIQQEIEFCYKYINLECKKISRVSWKYVVLEIQKTLQKIQKRILTESKIKLFNDINKLFGIILNIYETPLEKEKTAEIIAQYLMFHPILKKIYVFEDELFVKKELDAKINALNLDSHIQATLDNTINFFTTTLGFQYQNLDDKEHIFNQIYNDVLKETNPTLTKDNGMYYTPEWLVKSLWDILIHVGRLDFQKEEYYIIDPACGTAPFISHVLRHHLSPSKIFQHQINKYYNDLLYISEINFISYMVGLFKIAIAAKKENFVKKCLLERYFKTRSSQESK